MLGGTPRGGTRYVQRPGGGEGPGTLRMTSSGCLGSKGQAQGGGACPPVGSAVLSLDFLLWAAGHRRATGWPLYLRTDHCGMSSIPQSVGSPSCWSPR